MIRVDDPPSRRWLIGQREPDETLTRDREPSGVPSPPEENLTFDGMRAVMMGLPNGSMSKPVGSRGSPSLPPLNGLQVLRGIAALAVVVNHAISEAENLGFLKANIDADFGSFGVDIFFVISGFIMVYSNVGSISGFSTTVDFLARRLIRIVPLYWIVATGFLVALEIVREDPGLSLPYVVASYLFVPYPEPQDGAAFPFYYPAWTLEFEMFFYFCFAIALIWPRYVGVPGLCGFLVLYLLIGSRWAFPPPLDYWVSSQLLEFVAGCLVAELYLRGRRLTASVCRALTLGATVAVFVVWYCLGGWPEARGLVWGLPATALVAANTLNPARAPYRFETVLARIGDASYSLYMVHVLVFLVVFHFIRHAFRHWQSIPPAVYIGLLLISTIVTALVGFTYVERPLTKTLNRRLARHHPRA